MAIEGQAPYQYALDVTKSDTVNFDGTTFSGTAATKAVPCDALFIGGAGIVVAVFENGETHQFTCVAGQILPVRMIRVNSTTTTATLMVALYFQNPKIGA